jgi:hypothetical protein
MQQVLNKYWKFKKLHWKFQCYSRNAKSEKNTSFLDVINRFGDITEREIDENAIRSVPKNTEKGKNSVWIQFMSFCTEKSTHLIYHWFQVFCTVAGKKKVAII